MDFTALLKQMMGVSTQTQVPEMRMNVRGAPVQPASERQMLLDQSLQNLSTQGVRNRVELPKKPEPVMHIGVRG